MLAKTTCMASVQRRAAAAERVLTERGGVRVPETLMPEIHGDHAGEGRARRSRGSASNRVQIPGRVTAQNHCPGAAVLDRKTKFIKLYSDRIITTKLTNGQEILNERGRKNYVAKNKRRRSSDKRTSSDMSDRKVITVTDDDRGGRKRGADVVKVTGGGGHVRCSTRVEVPVGGAS